MKNIIAEKLKHSLELNQCFKKMIETEDEIKIIKSEYRGSSIVEIRELTNIYDILYQYEDNLEIIKLLDGIAVQFRKELKTIKTMEVSKDNEH